MEHIVRESLMIMKIFGIRERCRYVLGGCRDQGGFGITADFENGIDLSVEIDVEYLSARGSVEFGFCRNMFVNLDWKIYLCVGLSVRGNNLDI